MNFLRKKELAEILDLMTCINNLKKKNIPTISQQFTTLLVKMKLQEDIHQTNLYCPQYFSICS